MFESGEKYAYNRGPIISLKEALSWIMDQKQQYEVKRNKNILWLMSEIFLQWTISELACYTYSLVSVPLYDTLGTEAISYILDKSMSVFYAVFILK